MRRVLFLLVLAACARQEDPPLEVGSFSTLSENDPVPLGPQSHNTGTVQGVVRLAGKLPGARSIEAHGKAIPDLSLQVGEGGAVANAFVWIERGLEGVSFAWPTRRHTLTFRNERFDRRVVGVRTGDSVEFHSPDVNFCFGWRTPDGRLGAAGVLTKGGSRRESLRDPGVMHSLIDTSSEWRVTHIGVVDHPFYAVTGADGGFRLEKVLEGRFRFAVWHEKLGVLRKDAVVKPDATGAGPG